jgi:hypothetical protein
MKRSVLYATVSRDWRPGATCKPYMRILHHTQQRVNSSGSHDWAVRRMYARRLTTLEWDVHARWKTKAINMHKHNRRAQG